MFAASLNAPQAVDESTRLRALRRLELLDTPADPEFDELAALARGIFGTPMALISLVDAERQWFKARIGLPFEETPRSDSFCSHVVSAGRPMVVTDASQDARFASSALVRGSLHVRFYAGAPIYEPDGNPIGAVCVMDVRPREVSSGQLEALTHLANTVSRAIARRAIDLGAHQRSHAASRMREVERNFIHALSHELRTPLAASFGALRILESGRAGELSERASELTLMASRSTRRLVRVFEDLIDFESLRLGATEVQARKADLGLLVTDAVRHFVGTEGSETSSSASSASSAVSRGPRSARKVRYEPAPERLPVFVDHARIRHCIDTLLSNAARHSPPDTRLVVRAGRDGDGAYLEVADAGGAIPEGALHEVFDRFACARPTPDGQQSGAGIALALVDIIAGLHGGRVTCSMRDDGVDGAVVRMWLPTG